MLNVNQFRQFIIKPALQGIKLWSQAAENLIVGTALQESRLTFLHQNGGPALGVMQIEPATYDSICQTLQYHRDLLQLILNTCSFTAMPKDASALMGNITLSIIIARLIYYFQNKEPLPDANDITALGAYYKKTYNSPLGQAKVEDFIKLYNQFAV